MPPLCDCLRAGRVRRLLLTLPCLIVALVGSVILNPARASASPVANGTAAIVRFTGAFNVAGFLNNLNVSASTLTISAGDAVSFVNDSGVGLTLTIAQQAMPLTAGQARVFQFVGGADTQQVPVSATAINAPVISSLTSNTALVTVQPVRSNPSATPSGSAEKPPMSTPTPAQIPSAAGDRGVPGGVGRAGAAATEPRRPAVDDQAAPPSPSPTSQRQAQAPGTGGAPKIVEEKFGSAQREAAAPNSPKTVAVSDADSPEGRIAQVGLSIAVALVLLIGVGAAALRTLLVYREARD